MHYHSFQNRRTHTIPLYYKIFHIPLIEKLCGVEITITKLLHFIGLLFKCLEIIHIFYMLYDKIIIRSFVNILKNSKHIKDVKWRRRRQTVYGMEK